MKIEKQIPQFMLDFETLGTSENAVVTRIAITPFMFNQYDVTYEQLLNRSLYIALDVKDQIENYNRVVDKSTIEFWKTQSRELRQESIKPTDNDLSLVDGLNEIKNFLKEWGYDSKYSFTWCRGINFEAPIMNTMNKQAFPNDKYPILSYRLYHDCRTFNWCMSSGKTDKYIPKDFNQLNHIEHHAKHDAALDVYRMLKLLNLQEDL